MIKANNISICYRMSHDKIQSIKEYLVALIKHKIRYEEFRALEDVSFEIQKGEIVGYTEMLNEARAIATKRMVEAAEALGADAVVGMRYASSSVMQGAAEVVAYGTAVKFV